MNNKEDSDALDELAEAEWRVGEEVTILVSGTTLALGIPGFGGEVYGRGAVVRVTIDTLTYRQDELEWIGNPDQQLRKWGVQRVARGRIELDPWDKKGDPIWEIHREQARQLAHSQADPRERARALAEVQRKFGSMPTSVSTDILPGQSSEARKLAEDDFARSQRPRAVISSS
ncbi:hypothetical protein FHX49_000012 [Microbacterium endophyticum]|uniref:Uncharacterized protein n=1 Tax=Microbacterium endophyticum TaxID=1526412 RepID=A0A7W4YMC0_9MICO|nr:hypothetical protein [Microbacterium endophyticum]MBB2974471.1 hypothetical protein [Microbacterium endophyticum]NIK36768.1 hypothetical protein [Microbacterium endophyticum]